MASLIIILLHHGNVEIVIGLLHEGHLPDPPGVDDIRHVFGLKGQYRQFRVLAPDAVETVPDAVLKGQGLHRGVDYLDTVDLHRKLRRGGFALDDKVFSGWPP